LARAPTTDANLDCLVNFAPRALGRRFIGTLFIKLEFILNERRAPWLTAGYFLPAASRHQPVNAVLSDRG
jgi:hypothetical protein